MLEKYSYELWNGNCLELMKSIPDKSIDMILCDLPYGTTKCKWDIVIPFKPMWDQYSRIAKDNAHDTFNSSLPGIILTGFTLTHNSTNVRATLNNKTKSAEGKTYEGATDLIRDILAATKTTAGVMTAADKTNLDNTVQGLANEITNRT